MSHHVASCVSYRIRSRDKGRDRRVCMAVRPLILDLHDDIKVVTMDDLLVS
jgi:hypothetical protein